jgi:hypothetical protein
MMQLAQIMPFLVEDETHGAANRARNGGLFLGPTSGAGRHSR